MNWKASHTESRKDSDDCDAVPPGGGPPRPRQMRKGRSFGARAAPLLDVRLDWGKRNRPNLFRNR